MGVRKRDTSRGFNPTLPMRPEIVVPSRETLRMDGRLDTGTLSPAIHQLLLTMARLRNVVSSLRIEGEHVDLESARRTIETNQATTPMEEQVLRVAREYAQIHNTSPNGLPDFTIDYVTGFHRRIFDGLHPDANPGRLKTHPNGILDTQTGGFVFEATPPARTRAELEALFSWFQSQQDKAPTVAVAAIFFAEFEAIHPFHDGNGRIGRLLNMVAVKKLGYRNIALVPLDGRFFRTQEAYYEKLATTNNGTTWHLWTRYYADQLSRAYENALKRADLRPVLDQQSRPATRKLLEWVLTRDASPFQHSDYPNPSDYGPTAIRLALAELTRSGILTAKGERKGRRYELNTEFLRRVYGHEFPE